jgi:hypothetical protein
MARSDPVSQVPLPVLGAAALTVGLLGTLIGVLYWLMQPTTIANPGLGAYRPPSAVVESRAP